jgi:hypothetical protein
MIKFISLVDLVGRDAGIAHRPDKTHDMIWVVLLLTTLLVLAGVLMEIALRGGG